MISHVIMASAYLHPDIVTKRMIARTVLMKEIVLMVWLIFSRPLLTMKL